ncbi:hypothetical protein BHE74_00026548 [Ensete ventricosum]|nr:hypothetical protein BHE74_00026548 [Ensete ventricosum]
MNLDPQVVSHLVGNPWLVVVSLSSRRVTPANSRVARALEVVKLCYDSNSTLMARRLVPQIINSTFHFPGNILMTRSQMASVYRPTPLRQDFEIFNMARMKLASCAASDAASPSMVSVPPAPTVEHPTLTIEKCPRAGGEVPLKKKSKVAVSKGSARATGGST